MLKESLIEKKKVPVKFILVASLLSLATLKIDTATCFWLTDSTLFAQPVSIQAGNPSGLTSTTTKDEIALQKVSIGGDSKSWLLVAPAKQQQQQQPQVQQQQLECSCDVNWLQNQTNLLLNKWLASFQMRPLALSNSTGAIGNISGSRVDAKHHHELQQQQQHFSNLGNHWVRKGAGNGGGSASGNGHRAARAKHSQQQLMRGPQGPKGETGARGEKGERGERGTSGLVVVRDRDALFDLLPETGTSTVATTTTTTTATTATTTGDNKQTSGQLVFVEAEQVLVVRTQLGWQPVPLLKPLRDFRKAIGKFSLSSSEERRRLLLLSDGENMDNSIRRRNNLSTKVGEKKLAAGEVDEDEDEDEEDEEEDVDDDDDEDDDGETEEMDELTQGNDEDKKLVQTGRDKSSSRRRQAVNGGSPKVTARSGAAAALVAASIENSLTNTDQLISGPPTGSHAKLMKLRIAALNEPFSGNVHGIRGADFECKRNAARANVKGSFRSLLATNFQNLNEIVRYNSHKYPLVNLRGEVLVDSWSDLFRQQGRVTNPFDRIYSFDGRHVGTDANWPNKLIWLGTQNKAAFRDSVHNCDGWHSDSLNKFGYATPLHPPRGTRKSRQKGRHLGGERNLNSTSSGSPILDPIEKYPCRMPLVVLCVETVGQQSEAKQVADDLESNNLISV